MKTFNLIAIVALTISSASAGSLRSQEKEMLAARVRGGVGATSFSSSVVSKGGATPEEVIDAIDNPACEHIICPGFGPGYEQDVSYQVYTALYGPIDFHGKPRTGGFATPDRHNGCRCPTLGVRCPGDYYVAGDPIPRRETKLCPNQPPGNPIYTSRRGWTDYNSDGTIKTDSGRFVPDPNGPPGSTIYVPGQQRIACTWKDDCPQTDCRERTICAAAPGFHMTPGRIVKDYNPWECKGTGCPRDPNYNQHCPKDVKVCPGSGGGISPDVTVGRDGYNNCEFKECPKFK